MNQISIFLENKPGTLKEMTQIFSDNNINMRAASLVEAEGFGIMRVIVDDIYEATMVLKNNGYVNKITPVVVASIPDRPGGLIEVLDILSKQEINVDYMYAFSGTGTDEAHMVFKVAEAEIAEKALKKAGIKILEVV